ncbi:MAG: hypothetical protein OEU26_10620 [Candidatus Tectomicrobia bacterium]|nr:hypothetical protein [Candidatus Tectomicrobia bacterium]
MPLTQEPITVAPESITASPESSSTAPQPITAGAVLYQRQGLTIVAMLMAVALVLSIGGNVYQLWLSGAVHYVTVGTGKRMSRPGEIPPQALRDTATSFVQLVGNGTPAGLAENWADAERYMTSNAREAFARVKAEQFPMIVEGQISITTEALKVTSIDTIRQGSYNLYKVNIKGQQTVRYGSMSMGSLAAEFSVTLLAGNKDGVNGLWIADFYWPPLSVKAGMVSKR